MRAGTAAVEVWEELLYMLMDVTQISLDEEMMKIMIDFSMKALVFVTEQGDGVDR